MRRTWTLTVRTDTLQSTTEDHKLVKKVWIHASRHIIINTDGEEETGKAQMGRGHGSLTSATTVVNFEPEMDTAVSHGVESVLSFQHNAHHIVSKTKGFPNLKINTSRQLFWRLLSTRASGKANQTCIHFSKSGLGCPPLTLFALHIYIYIYTGPDQMLVKKGKAQASAQYPLVSVHQEIK